MNHFWREYGGPFINELGLYQHGGVCSGGPRSPRRPGSSCSCWRSDLFYNRLFVERHFEDGHYTGNTKRTLYVANCACGKRYEFPYKDQPIPRECYCSDCGNWTKVEELSWDGFDFSQFLPVIPR